MRGSLVALVLLAACGASKAPVGGGPPVAAPKARCIEGDLDATLQAASVNPSGQKAWVVGAGTRAACSDMLGEGLADWIHSWSSQVPMTEAAVRSRRHACQNGDALWADALPWEARLTQAWSTCDLGQYGLLTEADMPATAGPSSALLGSLVYAKLSAVEPSTVARTIGLILAGIPEDPLYVRYTWGQLAGRARTVRLPETSLAVREGLASGACGVVTLEGDAALLDGAPIAGHPTWPICEDRWADLLIDRDAHAADVHTLMLREQYGDYAARVLLVQQPGPALEDTPLGLWKIWSSEDVTMPDAVVVEGLPWLVVTVDHDEAAFVRGDARRSFPIGDQPALNDAVPPEVLATVNGIGGVLLRSKPDVPFSTLVWLTEAMRGNPHLDGLRMSLSIVDAP